MTDKETASRSDKLSEWEEKWADPEYKPDWGSGTPPRELQKAATADGYKPQGRILDIGCGQGDMSAWLAKQGYQVMGIDFSQNAIERAQQAHEGIDNLRFESIDICSDVNDIGPFDGLFDRGCLHGLPAECRQQYVQNVANWTEKGAKFLLLLKTIPDENAVLASWQQKAAAQVKGVFERWFEVRGARSTRLAGGSNGSSWAVPAISVWMIRK